MNGIKHICTIALALLSTLAVGAQSIMWSMPPTNYHKLEYLGFEMFKATDANGKFSILDANGTMLAQESVFDELTPFYDNWALLLSNQSGKKRVVGCISIDRICNIFPSDAEYYAIENQAFFSCGLLTVENKAGKKGYIDEQGEAVIDFTSGYDKVMPFSENFAAVFKNGRYMLINKFGEKMPIVLPRVGEIRGGTNVNEGKALVWDASGHYYNYDVNQKSCSKASKPSKNAAPDYLYRLTDKGDTPPYMTPQGREGIAPISSNGKYGYTTAGNKTLIPCQLVEASPFVDGYAIVKTQEGKVGILQFNENSSSGFSIKAVDDNIKYSPGESVTCRFSVTTPDNWSARDIKASIDGVKATTSGKDGNYSFKYAPSEQHKDFTVNISSEGLTLYSSTIGYNFSKKEGKSSSSKDKSEKVSKKDNSSSKKSDKQASKNSEKPKQKEETKKPKRL